jgi:hypothetical protein
MLPTKFAAFKGSLLAHAWGLLLMENLKEEVYNLV